MKALLMEDPPGDIIKTYLDRELSLIIQDTPEREKLINFYVQGEHTTGWDAIRTFLRQIVALTNTDNVNVRLNIP